MKAQRRPHRHGNDGRKGKRFIMGWLYRKNENQRAVPEIPGSALAS